MQKTQEQRLPQVGRVDIEVFGAGRQGRYLSSKFEVRCDAIGLHENEMLLLSVVGPETSVKALTAGLRSSGKEQNRITYTAHVGPVNRTDLTKCPRWVSHSPQQAHLWIVARPVSGSTTVSSAFKWGHFCAFARASAERACEHFFATNSLSYT